MRWTTLALISVWVLAGCDGSESGRGSNRSAPKNNTIQSTPTPEELIAHLTQPDQKLREQAHRSLLSMRGAALPHLHKGVDDLGVENSGELFKVLIELGRMHVKGVAQLLRDWLLTEFPKEKMALLRKANGKNTKETEDLSKALSQLIVGMLQIGMRTQIPESTRVFYNVQVLSGLARANRSNSLSSQEATGELLSLGASAIPEVVGQLNSSNLNVAERFAAVAIHMHRKQVVEAIIKLLADQDANNLWIYSTLNYLTLNEIWLQDLGEIRPAPEEFQQNPDRYLTRWRPKFQKRWNTWWQRHSQESLEEWWLAGFTRAGYAIQSTRSSKEVPRLIEALKDDSQVIRAAALTCLRRNTYHELSRCTYMTVLEVFPTGQVRTQQDLIDNVARQWANWWLRYKNQRRADLARAEVNAAISHLRLSMGLRGQRSFKPRELQRLFAAEFYLRKLTGGRLPDLPWMTDFRSYRERRRILGGLQSRIPMMFKEPRLLDRLETGPWWY